MSLPSGFLDDLRQRASLVQVAGRKVIWDSRKSSPAKGDMWAPCPFHQEKTPSFHVDDKKGFYHCFGCGASGDVIKFVRETENASFMEAVETLAAEVGMKVPALNPHAQQESDLRHELSNVLEQAVQFFRLQMKTEAASEARNYLERRGLNKNVRDRWEIGFAPDSWQALWDHLTRIGVNSDLVYGSGLAKKSEKMGKPYDVFRNRIMFPIRDSRGKMMAFGGRAVDPNESAKYINSPETALFLKGSNLYHYATARASFGKSQPLIVAEGYMDVIALSEAGFKAAVAPLGTAITEQQLKLLWRIASEPILALDGDKAGLNAATRTIGLALPLIESGQSLFFAILPEGQDPDDLIRSSGRNAMVSILEKKIPMVDFLCRQETDGRTFDTPERKALLKKTLEQKIQLIRDSDTQKYYKKEIDDYCWKLFRINSPGYNGHKIGSLTQSVATSSVRHSLVATSIDGANEYLREAVILAAIISTPEILSEFEADILNLKCRDPSFATVRDCLLSVAKSAQPNLREEITQKIGSTALEKLFSIRQVKILPCIRRQGDVESARLTVSEELQKLRVFKKIETEVAEAEEDLKDNADESITWRLREAADARNDAMQIWQEEKLEYDIGPNGARIDRRERADLADMMKKFASIKYQK